MNNSPEPEQTPDGPAYEGRLLVRPDDEVVDQGAGFDIGTIITRRRVLGLVGVGAGVLTLAACGSNDSSSASSSSSDSTDGSDSSSSDSATTTEGEIPEETNGPYPADGTNDVNVLTESGIERSDITTSLGSDTAVDGVPLTMNFNIIDMANDNAAFAGAAVYIWQCDAQGQYSMYTSGVEDETFLRGIQAADDNGDVSFTTIVPGCYAGRWPHIHMEIYPDIDSATDVANAIATTQIAFTPDMLADVYALEEYSGSTENLEGVGTEIADDDIFGDGDWELEVPTFDGDVDSGYTGTLAISVDTTTENGGAGGGGGEAPSGGGPGGGEGGEPPSGEMPTDMPTHMPSN